MIIKGRNSGRYKITHNKGDFRDGVCLKPLKITLRDNHDIQTTYEVFRYSLQWTMVTQLQYRTIKRKCV